MGIPGPMERSMARPMGRSLIKGGPPAGFAWLTLNGKYLTLNGKNLMVRSP